MADKKASTCVRDLLTGSNPPSMSASIGPNFLRERSSVVSVSARSSLIGTSPNMIMEELARAAAASSLAASPLIPLSRVSTTFRDRLSRIAGASALAPSTPSRLTARSMDDREPLTRIASAIALGPSGVETHLRPSR